MRTVTYRVPGEYRWLSEPYVLQGMIGRPSVFMPRAWWAEAQAAFSRVLGEEASRG